MNDTTSTGGPAAVPSRPRPTLTIERRWAILAAVATAATIIGLVIAVIAAGGGPEHGRFPGTEGSGAPGLSPPSPGAMPGVPPGTDGSAVPQAPYGSAVPPASGGSPAAPGSSGSQGESSGSDEPLTPESLETQPGKSGGDSKQ